MSKRDGQQKGPQDNAEGQHGSKTHDAFIDGRHGRHGGSPESEGAPQEQTADTGSAGKGSAETGSAVTGKHRLFEDRQQHDEADKNSEKNRLARELDREGKPVDGPSLKGKMRT